MIAHDRSPSAARRALPYLTALFVSLPFLGASAAPPPSASASAAPPPEVMSAALFSGTSSAPSAAAWKTARPLEGVRVGRDAARHKCVITHVAEWIRVTCPNTGRADLVAGEKRDLTLTLGDEPVADMYGDAMTAQFSMRPGDRRVIQWIEPDLWWSVWDHGAMASGFMVTGAMSGAVLQVAWAAGSEPVLSMY